MFCSNCGFEIITNDAAACPKCGNALRRPPSIEPAMIPGAPPPPGQAPQIRLPQGYAPPGYTPPPMPPPRAAPRGQSTPGWQQQPPPGYNPAQPPPPANHATPGYMPPGQIPPVYNAMGVAPGGNFSAGDCIGEGWRLATSNLGVFIAGTLLYIIISFAAGLIPVAGPLLVGGPLMGGFFVLVFKAMNGNPGAGDIFKGFSRFLPLFLATIVTTVIIFIGCMLLIIPGIYLGICYVFTTPLIIDQNLGFWDAMETSRKTVSKCWFSVFGLLLLCFLVCVVGMLALGVGMLVAIPVCQCALGAAYTRLFPRMNNLP
jgi:hypothetical protein